MVLLLLLYNKAALLEILLKTDDKAGALLVAMEVPSVRSEAGST